MAEVLNVRRRQTRGKRHARRLRQSGAIPAVLYGHGEEAVSLAVPAEQVEAVVRHGTRLVELRGEVNEQALVKELQWDTWGTHILHVDFARVSSHERVEVEVPIEVRGEAPGVRQGGVIQQLVHQTLIECEAGEVPEALVLKVNELQLGGELTLADLQLPGTARLLSKPEETVVQCVAPAEAVEEEEREEVTAEAGKAEPELIKRKAGEEEPEA